MGPSDRLFRRDQAGLHTAPWNVKHARVEVEPGVRLHVAEVGDGPLVVLLHGFPNDWRLWQPLMPRLAQAGLRVVAVDLRGSGESDEPRGVEAYEISRLVRDVDQLIAGLGEHRASVVGHDWGGGLAWVFAMRYPQRLDKLVIMNAPHPRVFARALRTPRQLLRSWYILLFQLPWLPEVLTRARTGALNYYRAMWREPVVIVRIDQPVLVVWGERDPFLGRELAQPDADDVPHLTVRRFARAGHWVMRDEQRGVADAVVAFLHA
ncbi:MAG TPA: alpha/beta fold hydrolase [Chloroflexota bacterium]